MKICDLAAMEALDRGGVRTYLDEKRRHLVERTAHSHVLILPGAKNRAYGDPRARTYEIAAPMGGGFNAHRFVGWFDRISRILARESPDLIEIGSPLGTPWVARWHRYRRGTPVVGFHHPEIPEAVAPRGSFPGNWARSASRAYSKWVHAGCDAVVTPSADGYSALRALALENVHYVPLGVDLQTFHPDRRDRAVWAALGVHTPSVILVHAGRLDADKGVDRLVEAFRLARLSAQVSLVLIGDGPLRGWVEAAAREDSRIRVVGHEPDRQRLAQLLASADLYVTGGTQEAFALSVLEAQASGLGVIGVAAGALLDRVAPGTGILAAPGDAADLARALEEGLRRDRAAMGLAARRAVEEAGSWRATFDQLVDLYQEMVRQRVVHGTLGSASAAPEHDVRSVGL